MDELFFSLALQKLHNTRERAIELFQIFDSPFDFNDRSCRRKNHEESMKFFIASLSALFGHLEFGIFAFLLQ